VAQYALEVTAPYRIVSVLLKLAYSSCPLWFSSREGQNPVDKKGEVGKLHSTARGKKISQILGSCHEKVLLASGEMTPDDSDGAIVWFKRLNT